MNATRMKQYKIAVWMCMAIFFIIFLGGCEASDSPVEDNVVLTRFSAQRVGYFDTLVSLIVYAESAAEFDYFQQIFFDTLGDMHRLFDIFNPYPGVRNLYYVNQNAHIAPVAVDPAIVSLLTKGVYGHEITEGALNIAMGSVLRIWHRYRMEGRALPDMGALVEAYGFADINDLVIDTAANTVFFANPHMSVDVGSIGKIYGVEYGYRALVDAGVQVAVINAGGNIIAHNAPPGRDGWNVGIQDPTTAGATIDVASFTNLAMATSGGYERFFQVDGERFGHIISPATLMPAEDFLQVAVLHETPWLASILSTALFIMPLEDGYRLATTYGADAFWVDAGGGWFATEGYQAVSTEFGLLMGGGE